jgi:hypothetical protein
LPDEHVQFFYKGKHYKKSGSCPLFLHLYKSGDQFNHATAYFGNALVMQPIIYKLSFSFRFHDACPAEYSQVL